MQFNPQDIRRKTFQLMRRGFDPQEVGAYLEQLSAHVADLQQRATQAETRASGMEKDLADAKSAEEAVRLTMMAATQAKEEILAAAQEEAATLEKSSSKEAAEIRRAAKEEADRVLNEARREALATLESSRNDAEEMLAAARVENDELVAESANLRNAIESAKAAMAALANGALHELTALGATLPAAPGDGQWPVMSIVPPLEGDGESSTHGALGNGAQPDLEMLENHGGEVVLLPDAVDRLLTQLRDINS